MNGVTCGGKEDSTGQRRLTDQRFFGRGPTLAIRGTWGLMDWHCGVPFRGINLRICFSELDFSHFSDGVILWLVYLPLYGVLVCIDMAFAQVVCILCYLFHNVAFVSRVIGCLRVVFVVRDRQSVTVCFALATALHYSEKGKAVQFQSYCFIHACTCTCRGFLPQNFGSSQILIWIHLSF